MWGIGKPAGWFWGCETGQAGLAGQCACHPSKNHIYLFRTPNKVNHICFRPELDERNAMVQSNFAFEELSQTGLAGLGTG
jgi:hypothetical protein